MFVICGVDVGVGIGDYQLQVDWYVGFVLIFDGQCQYVVIWYCLDGIDQQVDQYLLQFVVIVQDMVC